ncbi:MAG: hypothetical protein Q8O57_13805, partial [Kiritimatiellota bacterium]|nr:hypothetical protein [Kiritimatiellota bacterium]
MIIMQSIAMALVFAVLAVTSWAKPPEVSHFTTPGPGSNEIWLILGHNFVPGKTEVTHYVLPTQQLDSAETDGWIKEVGKVPPLPAKPPKESQPLEILDATDSALVVRGVRTGCPLFAFWVKTPDGLSQPQLANLPEPYWVGREKLEPDEISMVFGNRCAMERRWEIRFGRIVLKPKGGGAPRELEVLKPTHNRTGGIMPFRVPMDTPPGAYELWVHNGWGDKWGWGGPLML